MVQFTRSVVTMVMGFVAFFWFVAQPDKVERKHDDAPPAITNGQQVVLTRASDGHFYTDAQVNGRTIHFLVDTGASSVALSREDAETVGLPMDPSKFTGIGRGASGELSYMPVTLDTVGIGSLEETGVDGVVLAGHGDMSLLGQSWLKRIRSVTIADDKMTLE